MTDDQRVVAATTELTLDELRSTEPMAIGLITLISYLGPDDIPRRLLLRATDEVPQPARSVVTDPPSLARGIATLTRYALVWTVDNAIAIHRETQAAVRNYLPRSDQEIWATAAGRTMLRALPHDFQVRDWPWMGRMLPHALTIIRHLYDLGSDPILCATLQGRTARYLISQGRLDNARKDLERAVTDVERLQSGSRLHGRLLTSLATAERELGQFTVAKRHATKAMAIHRSLVPRSPSDRGALQLAGATNDAKIATDQSTSVDGDLAEDLEILGTICRLQGDFDEALGVLHEAYDIVGRVHGFDSIQVAEILEQSFSVFIEKDLFSEAIQALRTVIEIHERSDEADDRELSARRQLLALMTTPENSLSSARTIVDDFVEAYGPRHPATAGSLRGLSTVLLKVGQHEEARSTLEKAHRLDLDNFGPHHYRLAADHLDLMLLNAYEDDLTTSEESLRQAIHVVTGARPEDQDAVLRLAALNRVLVSAALSDNARPILTRVLPAVADAGLAEADVGFSALTSVINAVLVAGDYLMIAKRYAEASEQYHRGAELALLTVDNPIDDAVFEIRLGCLAGVASDRAGVVARLRSALDLPREVAPLENRVWWLVKQCDELFARTGAIDIVPEVLNLLVDEAKEQGEMAVYKPSLTSLVPTGWFVKESITLLAADGQANVIASSEPLDPTVTIEQYAETQGNLLATEFNGYEEKSYEPWAAFGVSGGYLRSFEWTPDDGKRVWQTQIYYVENSRGYTATATTPADNYREVAIMLDQVLRNLRLDGSGGTSALGSAKQEDRE
jgi:tetratricopeptide (TPR) repeat protein